MLSFLAWYLAITLLGWLTFPLVFRLFPALADRGYSLARAAGLLIWAYAFWILTSLGISQNDLGGIFLGAWVLLGLSGLAVWKSGQGFTPILDWAKANRKTVIAIEVLFLLAFAFMAFVRASNPEATATEKPMELAFINAILRSPTFPPRDPWLSGYAISYYYFGYVMTAMLARLTGTIGSVAYNLMSPLVFALTATGAYGLVFNLLAALKKNTLAKDGGTEPVPYFGSLPLLGPLFLLLVSNFEGILDVLHKRGVFWKFQPDGSATSSFWKWLDLKELSVPPTGELGWIPQRSWWWWRASRVIQDYELSGLNREIIDEFPAFSYVLGDLHPHVMALPFGLLAIAMALNLFLGGWKGRTNLLVWELPIHPAGFLFSTLTLGGLAFLNTWDVLPYLALLLGAFVLGRVRAHGWSWSRLEELILLTIPLGVLSLLLYLPFYIGFSSQLGGILPNLVNPTRGVQFWIMWGTLFLPIFAYLVYLWVGKKQKPDWRVGLAVGFGLPLLLWGFSWFVFWLAIQAQGPVYLADYLVSQDVGSGAALFSAAFERRLATGGSFIGFLDSLGTWLTLGLLLSAIVALLARLGRSRQTGTLPVEVPQEAEPPAPEKVEIALPPILGESHPEEQATKPVGTLELSGIHYFVLLLLLVGTLLVLAPEYVFLRDQFNNRMNTIFKFYYQAWALWSVAAAFGAALLLQRLQGFWLWLHRVGLTLLLLVGLVYSVLGFTSKTNNFQWTAFKYLVSGASLSGDWSQVTSAWTLDAAEYMSTYYPFDIQAIQWLKTAPDGILVEAVGGQYSDYAQVATHTGLQNVLGWPGHESQWRGTSVDDLYQRELDIRRLYETSYWEEALEILDKYDIRYVYIGTNERIRYNVNELKFDRNLAKVLEIGGVVIYLAP